jgi:hypothetical protein
MNHEDFIIIFHMRTRKRDTFISRIFNVWYALSFFHHYTGREIERYPHIGINRGYGEYSITRLRHRPCIAHKTDQYTRAVGFHPCRPDNERSATMKLQPVKSYRTPGYPGENEFNVNESLMAGAIPTAWKQNALVTAALMAFTALTASGVQASGQQPAPFNQVPALSCSIQQAQFTPPEHSSIDYLAAAGKKAVVAPIFIHGGGTGSSGGIAASPLSSLTEEEARKIIEGELKKSGIVCDRHNHPVKGAVVKGQDSMAGNRELSLPLVADGLDSKHNLAYEYVPAKSYDKIAHSQNGTLTRVNYVTLAESVRKGFESAGTVNAVVFYDPLPSRGNKKEGEKLLRAQVQDFITWAKEKKIIE